MSKRALLPPTIDASDLSRQLDERRRDEADRRQLRGKHAPPEGLCRSASVVMEGQLVKPCGGRVAPLIRFPVSNLIGGSPSNAYVAYWHCEECGVMYHAPPKRA